MKGMWSPRPAPAPQVEKYDDQSMWKGVRQTGVCALLSAYHGPQLGAVNTHGLLFTEDCPTWLRRVSVISDQSAEYARVFIWVCRDWSTSSARRCGGSPASEDWLDSSRPICSWQNLGREFHLNDRGSKMMAQRPVALVSQP